MSAEAIGTYQARIVRLERALSDIAELHGPGTITHKLALAALRGKAK